MCSNLVLLSEGVAKIFLSLLKVNFGLFRRYKISTALSVLTKCFAIGRLGGVL